MKRVGAILIVLVLLLAMAACHQQEPPARQFIALIDMSASIERKAQESAFQAIENTASHLRRGDSLTVIPITGDAANESQGRILRLTLSDRREAYDQDLRRAAANLRRSLEEMKAAALSSPGARTDILGALRIAVEEMRLAGKGRKTIIVILSDFIQDDAHFDFKTYLALRNEASAQLLGATSARSANLSLQDVPIFLGLLRSKDLAHIAVRRRLAIQAFWISYLTDSGAKPVLAEDGPGLLSTYLLSEARAGPSLCAAQLSSQEADTNVHSYVPAMCAGSPAFVGICYARTPLLSPVSGKQLMCLFVNEPEWSAVHAR